MNTKTQTGMPAPRCTDTVMDSHRDIQLCIWSNSRQDYTHTCAHTERKRGGEEVCVSVCVSLCLMARVWAYSRQQILVVTLLLAVFKQRIATLGIHLLIHCRSVFVPHLNAKVEANTKCGFSIGNGFHLSFSTLLPPPLFLCLSSSLFIVCLISELTSTLPGCYRVPARIGPDRVGRHLLL
jgi:hypothetical protein